MRYFTFLTQFHDRIGSRTKQTTIRKNIHVKVGEAFALRFWNGKPYGRGAKIGWLGWATCLDVRTIHIHNDSIMYELNGTCPSPHEIAIRDGFDDWPAMRDKFREMGGLPFSGQIIDWGRTFVAGEP